MLSQRILCLSLLVILSLTFSADRASAATLYRVGIPFSAAEKDSLDGLGIGFREIPWTLSQREEQIESESLQVGSLQPNFFEPEDNIAATIAERDGWIGVRGFANVDRMVGHSLIDNDPSTGITWLAIAPETFRTPASGSHASLAGRLFSQQISIDLGGRFLIREFRMRPFEDKPEHYLQSLRIAISDRDEYDDDGNHVSSFDDEVVLISENTEPEIRAVLREPVITEAVQMYIYRVSPKEVGLAEFEVLGGGFVGMARYESAVIELDDVASLGEIRWEGRQDPKAKVGVRTRAGMDPHPEIYWQVRPEQQDSVQYLDGGGQLSLAEYTKKYDRLEKLSKPLDENNWVSADTENWSFWSSPYEFSEPGVPIVSPGPRRFIQIRTDFTSTVEDGGQLDYIEFMVSSPPSVSEIVGEIYPVETQIGVPTQFTYFISPSIGAGDSSFDGVEISTPSGIKSVDALRIDAVDQGEVSWRIKDDGLGFEVLLPRRLDQSDSDVLVEVVFTAPVLREVGTQFAGRIFDSAQPNEVRQRVVPGDAAVEIDSDRLSVKTALSKSLVATPEISPNPFTPNGDDINDLVNISYKLLRVTSAIPVSIDIFDLSGRKVKEVYSGKDPLGEYHHTWDGTDASNNLVSPGLYLYRIDATVQSNHQMISGTVCVAY